MKFLFIQIFFYGVNYYNTIHCSFKKENVGISKKNLIVYLSSISKSEKLKQFKETIFALRNIKKHIRKCIDNFKSTNLSETDLFDCMDKEPDISFYLINFIFSILYEKIAEIKVCNFSKNKSEIDYIFLKERITTANPKYFYYLVDYYNMIKVRKILERTNEHYDIKNIRNIKEKIKHLNVINFIKTLNSNFLLFSKLISDIGIIHFDEIFSFEDLIFYDITVKTNKKILFSSCTFTKQPYLFFEISHNSTDNINLFKIIEKKIRNFENFFENLCLTYFLDIDLNMIFDRKNFFDRPDIINDYDYIKENIREWLIKITNIFKTTEKNIFMNKKYDLQAFYYLHILNSLDAYDKIFPFIFQEHNFVFLNYYEIRIRLVKAEIDSFNHEIASIICKIRNETKKETYCEYKFLTHCCLHEKNFIPPVKSKKNYFFF